MEAGDEKGRRRRISNCGGEGGLFLEGKMAHTARPSSPFIYYAAESRRERKKVRVPLLNFPSLSRRHQLVMATEEKGEGEHFPKFVRRKKYIFGLNVARAAWISPQSWTTLKKGKEKRRRFSRWSRKKTLLCVGKRETGFMLSGEKLQSHFPRVVRSTDRRLVI